ncbi:MFS transporter [Paeniglutamicibacter kerguelensis]|uniref:MFS family permease n=2 Tax=Paeniglutamicibacter kerguelensis TaxID=254788 RepID=A0ABS4XFB6_9MICC|nr:MFS family permease [Paeniglutamicibacter kerguelensis]
MDDQTFSMRSMALKVYSPSLLYSIGLGAVTPVIAISARDRGASIATAALIVTLVGVGSLVSNVPAALLTNKVGERTAMVAAAGWAAAGLALGLFHSELPLFAVGVTMLGMAGAVFNLARQSYLAEAVPVAYRARAMSTLGGVMRMGVFAGPFMATVAMGWWGITGAYWVGVAAMLLALVVCFAIPELPSRSGERGSARPEAPTISMWGMARKNRRVLCGVGLGVVCIAAVRSSRQIVLPLWGESLGLDAGTIALVYGLSGALDMLIFYPAGKVMDLKGRVWIAVPCLVIMAIAMSLLPLTTGIGMFTAVAMLLGFGNGIGSGIVLTLGVDYSPVHDRARFLGVWRLMADAGAMGGPILLSGMLAVATLGIGIWSIAAVSVLGAVLFGYFIPRSGLKRIGAP